MALSLKETQSKLGTGAFGIFCALLVLLVVNLSVYYGTKADASGVLVCTVTSAPTTTPTPTPTPTPTSTPTETPTLAPEGIIVSTEIPEEVASTVVEVTPTLTSTPTPTPTPTVETGL